MGVSSRPKNLTEHRLYNVHAGILNTELIGDIFYRYLVMLSAILIRFCQS